MSIIFSLQRSLGRPLGRPSLSGYKDIQSLSSLLDLNLAMISGSGSKWSQLLPVSPRFSHSFCSDTGMTPSLCFPCTGSIPVMCLLEPWTALQRARNAAGLCKCLVSTEATPRPWVLCPGLPGLAQEGVGWAGSVFPGSCLGGTDPAGPRAVATALSWRVTLSVWLGQQLGNACQNSSLLHFTCCLIFFPFCL